MRMDKATIRRSQGGFTLLEIMVVVVIIGLLAAMVVPNLMGNVDTAEINRARLDVRQIASALDMYRLDNYSYPTTAQGIEALVSNPGENIAPNWQKRLNSVAKDPWGREYQYRSPGRDGFQYEVFTLGRDGREGGEGIDADISSADVD
jgi:general secretion pathway protein G